MINVHYRIFSSLFPLTSIAFCLDSRTTYTQSPTTTSSHTQQQPKIPRSDRFDSEFPTLVADMGTKPRTPASAWGNSSILKEKILSPPSSTDPSVEEDAVQDPEIERLKALVPKRAAPRKGPNWSTAHTYSPSPSAAVHRHPGTRTRTSNGGHTGRSKGPFTKASSKNSEIPKKEVAAVVKLPLAPKLKGTEADHQSSRRYQTSSRSSLESYDNVDDLAMTVSLSSSTSQTSYLESPRTLLDYEDDDKRPVSPLDEEISIRSAISDDDKQRFINFICDRVCYHGGWGNSIRKSVMVEGEEKFHYELDSGSLFSVRF